MSAHDHPAEGDLWVQDGIGMNIAYHNDDRGDPTIEYWAFADPNDDDCECGRLEIRVHEILPSAKSGTLAVYYRQWFTPDGEPNGKPRRKVTALASLTALIRSRRMKRTPTPESEIARLGGVA
jgi:hypothetical protein